MKIEIGESLIFSWLRHVRGCPIVQTSWKPSPAWPVRHEGSLAADFERMREIAAQRLGLEMFKEPSFRQFIRQAEIDVLGLRFCDAGLSAVAVDSAFHENGGQYGDRQETVARILKKLIRTAIALEAYFDLHQAEIVFATLKMHNAVHDDLQRCWPVLQSILADYDSLSAVRMSLRIVANGDFTEQVMQPVLDRADQVADTSELFLRAQQLVRVCEATPRRPATRSSSSGSPPKGDGEPKIGEHVRITMNQLAASGRLTPEVVGALLDARYCKATFNLGLPFLKAVDPSMPASRQRIDDNGYGRYWKQPLRIGQHDFLMCSQWFVWQRGAYDRWVRELDQAHPWRPVAEVGPTAPGSSYDSSSSSASRSRAPCTTRSTSMPARSAE